MDRLLEDLQYIKGVGPKRSKQLNRLGLDTVFDLLWNIPRAYFNRANVNRITELKDGEAELQDTIRTKIARAMAVASAIKPGQQMNALEMQNMFDKLFACTSPNVSPSGKPTLFILGLDELENRFK